MSPLVEYAMRCLSPSCRRVWVRYGNTPTTCVFCGSVDTVVTRREERAA